MALREPNTVAGEDMGPVSTDTMPALGRGDVFGPGLERSQSATNAHDAAPASLIPSPADALVSAKVHLAEADAVAIVRAERERIIAEAQATAHDIVAEAERAAQDILQRVPIIVVHSPNV